jgi:TonB family protein
MNSVLEFFGTALVHGTAVAAFAAVVDGLARRWLSFGALSLLWVLALVKFVVPWGPSLRFSLSSAVVTGQGALPFEPFVISATGPAPGTAWVGALLFSYLVVVAVLVIRHLRGYRVLSAQVAQLPLAGDAVLDVAKKAAQRLGFVRLPTVRLGPSAFVLGWAHQTLVVPRGLVDEAELRSVVLHELAHLRRNDPWLRLLQHTVQVLFFFWPPVAWVNRRIEHYRELACDEIALRAGGLPVDSYARLLVKAQRLALARSSNLAVFEMSSQSSHLERRIDMLLNLKPSRSVVLSALTLVSWGLLTLSGSALATAPEVLGTLDREVIREVIHEQRQSIRGCYEEALPRSPTLQGEIHVRFTILPSGLTSEVGVEKATLTDAQVQACMVKAISTWKFPAPPGGGVVKVVYPFFFRQSAK